MLLPIIRLCLVSLLLLLSFASLNGPTVVVVVVVKSLTISIVAKYRKTIRPYFCRCLVLTSINVAKCRQLLRA